MNRLISFKNLPLILFLLLVCSSPVLAQQTIHVPQDAATIQEAIDTAHAGDTVLVSRGTYNENIDFHGKDITVTSGGVSFTDVSTTSTILNGTQDGPVATFDSGETSGAVLNGFTIQNGHSSVGASLPAAGVWISGASPTISNNLITNNTGNGILITNLDNASIQSSSSLIQGNDIRNTTTAPQTGVPGDIGTGLAITTAGNIQVIGNTIENNSLAGTAGSNQNDGDVGGGVSIKGGILGQTLSVLLKNNIIRNNHAQGGAGIAADVLFASLNLTLIQNLVYGNTQALTDANGAYYPGQQIQIFGTLQQPYPSLTEINNTIYGGDPQELGDTFGPSVFENNIFFNSYDVPNTYGFPGQNSGLWCADSFSAASPITIANNDIYNVGQLQDGGCNLGSNNLAVDPQFVNVSGNDFHTQPTSPVVAAGTVSAPDIPSADLDAKARMVCNTIDMGVYEVRPHPPILLTVTPNPAPGQSNVTLTATVTGNCNAPTGSIVFLDGTTVLGTAPLNGAAVASFSTSFLFVGTHILTATYAGDFNFDNSVSNTVTEVITGPPTSTVLNSINPNPAQSLQPVTMVATVSSAYTVPTGTVTFMAKGTALATAGVGSNGVASGVATSLHAGIYVVAAVYGGSTEYAASTSNALTLTVLAGNTTTSLYATPNPSAPGQTVTLAAQVAGALSGIPLTGTVTFKEGATTLGTANVGTNGVASFGIATLLTGTHSVTATYSGSSDYNASTSASIAVNVTAIPTSIALNVSPNPATVGQNVTMVATAIASLPNQVPTGTITFSDQSGVLGTASLVAGVATFSTAALSTGTHSITATLNPTGLFAPTTSSAVTEVINNFDFALTINGKPLTPPGNGSSLIGLSIPSGNYEVLNLLVTPSGGFTDAVKLGCDSVPDHAQCVFNPQTTQPLTGGAQTVQFTLNTSDVFGYGNKVGSVQRPRFGLDKPSTPLLAGILFPFVTLCSFLGCFFKRSNVRLQRLLLLLAVAGVSLSLEACSGKLPGKTPPGTYTIIVTGADAGSQTTLTHSLKVQLTVTP